jgi:hypothetical protein
MTPMMPTPPLRFNFNAPESITTPPRLVPGAVGFGVARFAEL